MCPLSSVNLFKRTQTMSEVKITIKKSLSYTAMSNYHLQRDNTISLKAKGLLSMLLSNSEDWQNCQRGIASLCSDGLSAVNSTMKSLQEHKYVSIERTKGDGGKFTGTHYTISEIPMGTDESELLRMKYDNINPNAKGNGTVFVVERPESYTLLSNAHLIDKNLSLKAKGLLSVFLSLPEKAVYCERDLCKYTSDGFSAVQAAIKELKEINYIVIERKRDEKGHLKQSIYHIYQTPKSEDKHPVIKYSKKTYDTDSFDIQENYPDIENPNMDNPNMAIASVAHPDTDFPNMEKPNTEIPNTENRSQTKNIITNNLQNNIYNNNPPLAEQQKRRIKERIGYDVLMERNEELFEMLDNDEIDLISFNSQYIREDLLDKIIDFMVDVYCKNDIALINKWERWTAKEIRECVHILIEKKPRNTRAYFYAILSNK